MSKLTAKDFKVVSEGQQIKDQIIKKYGENGIKVVANLLGKTDTTINKYLSYLRIESAPKTTELLLAEALKENLKYESIDSQISNYIDVIDNDMILYKGDIEVYNALDKLKDKANSEVVKAKIEVTKAGISSKTDFQILEILDKLLVKSINLKDITLTTYCLRTQAYLYHSNGDNAKSDELMRKAIKYEVSDKEKARLYHQLALNNWSNGMFKRALVDIKKAKYLYRNDVEGTLKVLNVQGVIEFKDGDVDAARRTFLRLEEMARLNNYDYYLLVAFNNQFDVYFEDADKAEYYSNEALKLSENVGFPKSKEIAKFNKVRYSARYQNDINNFEKLFNDLFSSELIDLESVKTFIDLLVVDIKKNRNGALYIKLAIDSIIKLISRTVDPIKINKYESILGRLINKTIGRVNDEEEGFSIYVCSGSVYEHGECYVCNR